MCFFQAKKTPLAHSSVPHHALNTSFYAYKTSRYVTMSIYSLQNTFSMFLSSSRQHALTILSSGCSMFSPLQKKVVQIAIFLSHAVNTSSLPAWCVNIQFLPCKSPWFTTLFRRKTRLEYAVSCLQTHRNMIVLPRMYLYMLLLSGKTPTTCSFLPVQYLRPAPTHRNVRRLCYFLPAKTS